MRGFADSLRQVLSAMCSHKLRSFLTMFGIAWGVGSLLLLVFQTGGRAEHKGKTVGARAQFVPGLRLWFEGRLASAHGLV